MSDNNTDSEVTTITIYTDGSTKPNPGISAYGYYGKDNLGIAYSGYGPVSINASNNVAEIVAVVNVIEHFSKSFTACVLNVFSDSNYVLNGINSLSTWENNKWCTKLGAPIANLDKWLELQRCIKAFKEKGNKISFTWVKGHNGNIENELADKNATKGRLALASGDDSHVHEIISDVEISNQSKPTAIKEVKVKKAVQPLPTPLLTGKRWFFFTNVDATTTDGRHIYTTSTYEDKKDTRNKNLGKRNPDTHYSIVVTTTPVETLDKIRGMFNTGFIGKQLPAVVDLSTVFKKSVWGLLTDPQDTGMVIKGELLTASDTSVLGSIINPPKLIYKLDNIYTYGLYILKWYESVEANNTYRIDITSHVFTVDNKGKQKINDELTTGLKAIVIKDLMITENYITDVLLTLGVDIPLRNAFSAILKQSNEVVSITLMVFEVTDFSYRIATVVKYGDYIGVFYTPDANYRIVTMKKSKEK